VELEVADVFRRHGAEYRQAHAGTLGRAQLRVMRAIELCRTAALGGAGQGSGREAGGIPAEGAMSSSATPACIAGSFTTVVLWANSVIGSQRRLSVEFRPFSSAMALLRTFILSP